MVYQVVPEIGGKYSVSVGVGVGIGSVVSDEQLMQNNAANNNSIDFDMVANIDFWYDLARQHQEQNNHHNEQTTAVIADFYDEFEPEELDQNENQLDEENEEASVKRHEQEKLFQRLYGVSDEDEENEIVF